MIDKLILYNTRKEHVCRGYADHLVIDEATSYFAHILHYIYSFQ